MMRRLFVLAVVDGLAFSSSWFEGRRIAAHLKDCTSEGCVVGDLDLGPSRAPSDQDKKRLSEMVDYLYLELLKLSADEDLTANDDDDDDDDEDMFEFIQEGRKMLAISESRVCYGEDEDALADDVWRGIAGLLADDRPQTGLLVAMPNYVGDAMRYVDEEIVAPLDALGYGTDRIEVQGYRQAQGAPFPAFRLLYSPAK